MQIPQPSSAGCILTGPSTKYCYANIDDFNVQDPNTFVEFRDAFRPTAEEMCQKLPPAGMFYVENSMRALYFPSDATRKVAEHSRSPWPNYTRVVWGCSSKSNEEAAQEVLGDLRNEDRRQQTLKGLNQGLELILRSVPLPLPGGRGVPLRRP